MVIKKTDNAMLGNHNVTQTNNSSEGDIIGGNKNVYLNKMNRRDFLKVALLAGVSGAGGSVIINSLFANIDSLAQYFELHDYAVFNSVNDLEKWADSRKIYTIVVDWKKDIYRGLIFPIFKSTDIKEIKFSSTSILWGHKSFGRDLISNNALDILSNYNHDKCIKIISSTPSMEDLYEEYGTILHNVMYGFNDVLSNHKNDMGAVVNHDFNKNYYRMLVKVKNQPGGYLINFLNENPSGKRNYIVKFSGEIYVGKLNTEDYSKKSKQFDEVYYSSPSYKRAIDIIG